MMSIPPPRATPGTRTPSPGRRGAGRERATVGANRKRAPARPGAATRDRILAAAVACVDELGLPGATLQRIARRAGVTVGAVQHHFLSKADVLDAVLEDSFAHFARCFQGEIDLAAPLDRRIATFVRCAWRHFGSPSFRSTISILLAARADPAAGRGRGGDAGLRLQRERALRLWRSIFPDAELRPEQQLELLRFAFSTLAGAALSAAIERRARSAPPELRILEATLRSRLEPTAAKPAPRRTGRSLGADRRLDMARPFAHGKGPRASPGRARGGQPGQGRPDRGDEEGAVRNDP